MASGDKTGLPKHMTYSKSRVPVLGALVDYLESSFQYLTRRGWAAEKLHAADRKSSLSAPFLGAVCLLLGALSCVKLEVVTLDEHPLPLDLHFMLLSKDEKLYIDDIDVSRVMWCVEASDLIVLCISCLLIWNSSHVRSPLSEYLFLPWVGVTLRGLFLRQAPTVGALVYTMAVVTGSVNPLFLTTFSFLFVLEARMWVEVCRAVRARWEAGRHSQPAAATAELTTLWSNDDVQSIEVQNYVY